MSSRTQQKSGSYSTTLTDDTTGNTWKIITITSDESVQRGQAVWTKRRVTGLSISFKAGENDAGATCTDAAMNALHDAIVTEFASHIGTSYAESGGTY